MANPPNISILVVDDEPAIRQVFTHFLERRGHHVVSCGTGEDALGAASKFEFDVCILDMQLPDMSGLDIVKELRLLNARTRVILLTGAPSEDAEERATQLNIYKFLTKPIRASSLIEVVEAAGSLSVAPQQA